MEEWICQREGKVTQRQLPPSHARYLVRKATQRDIEILVHQRRGMWEDIGFKNKPALDYADSAYRRWVKSALRNKTLQGWIAETKQGDAAGGGCVWLQPMEPVPYHKRLVQPYLLSMYTEPQFRRKGVASRIVAEAVNWCKKNGYPRLTLHASRKGRSLYRKHGFIRTWEMRRQLSRKGRH